MAQQQMNAYDTLIYARYPAEEAQARQDYDAACEAAENAQDRYEAALDTLIALYEARQPEATIKKHRAVVELDRLDRNRAQREAEAARLRLERVQRELRAPVKQ